jgi:hypothetical protein
MENIIYYLFLFFLVIIIRFFKLKNTYKDKFSENWKEVLFSSLEIVYTASGVVIALLLNVTKHWIAPVVIVYLVIVIFSALLEMSNENFGNRIKTNLHLIIILIVISSTIITYSKVLPKVDINGTPLKTNLITKPQKKDFTIIIPYYDNSLIRHVGNKNLKETPLIFETHIRSFTKDSVFNIVNKKLKNAQLIKQMFKSNQNEIEILEEKILVLESRKLNEYSIN